MLFLLVACLPLCFFSQGTKLLNAESVLMSSPENDISSTEILKTDTLDSSFYFNAIDWKYNENNELWLKLQCLKSAQQCCMCSPEKIAEGWIA